MSRTGLALDIERAFGAALSQFAPSGSVGARAAALFAPFDAPADYVNPFLVWPVEDLGGGGVLESLVPWMGFDSYLVRLRWA